MSALTKLSVTWACAVCAPIRPATSSAVATRRNAIRFLLMEFDVDADRRSDPLSCAANIGAYQRSPRLVTARAGADNPDCLPTYVRKKRTVTVFHVGFVTKQRLRCDYSKQARTT